MSVPADSVTEQQMTHEEEPVPPRSGADAYLRMATAGNPSSSGTHRGGHSDDEPIGVRKAVILEQADAHVELVPCSNCGRKFAASRIQIHMRVREQKRLISQFSIVL